MIVSKYFKDINDFINLEIGIKRFRGNMERFHFNPIPLNQYSRRLFPNIETFHIYKEEDEVELGDSCFYECKSLKSINIPTSVIEIGNGCFLKCSSLKSINIPSSITSFGIGYFCHCGCEEELKKNKTIPESRFKY
ncbi:leucine rich repeat protein bspa family [Entamoeba histolytica]|uniref:Leucine rich repeat protein, BspA family n=2 Tax=Entamoeba histolytica TaxID=5759 RepID=C4MBN9_ENTH1|nr:uncharacterized protein EHI_163960 [Entamoeba histolytica HM-1:IMSS]EAL44167.1 leucine rich repeat protein, BspA family [Entamoeba histolytica HM-1:IMSS]GAT99483.1 leucine rich repeat protein bspa family [Entamoeba histolytica]|eukprot:XP_649553.1 uncharacterized protein EHI_163960 [Entamoeba histolytica HM-1:IMSS]